MIRSPFKPQKSQMSLAFERFIDKMKKALAVIS